MVLVQYGQDLSETINAVSAALPGIRRALSAAWDLTGIWVMAWAGLLRIGEAVGSLREDLILPRDAAPGT